MCEFPNNTSPRELLARKETSAQYLIAGGTVVNRTATSFSIVAKQSDLSKDISCAEIESRKKRAGWLYAIPPRLRTELKPALGQC
jgi:hypothetical protein